MRVRIIRSLADRPQNTNQLSRSLGIDYKTADHHLRVLKENRIVVPSGEGYGVVFLLTAEMEACLPEFESIALKVMS